MNRRPDKTAALCEVIAAATGPYVITEYRQVVAEQALEAVRGYLAKHEDAQLTAAWYATGGQIGPTKLRDILRAADRVVGLRDDEKHHDYE